LSLSVSPSPSAARTAARAWPGCVVRSSERTRSVACWFVRSKPCNYTLHLIQTGHAITSSHNTSSSFISGSVHAPHIVVNFNGVSPEDDWTCSGTINAAKTIFHGTFTDGTGGSGTCRAVRRVP
jgi:hypothetical protein